MLYTVQIGDTLQTIADKFYTSVNDIIKANVICNPHLILVGQVLLIPKQKAKLLVSGGGPYYVYQHGDSLWCLASIFFTTVQKLAQANDIADPDMVYAGRELLLTQTIPNPLDLFAVWRDPQPSCDELTPLQVHSIYYLGSFSWEAIGKDGIPYLVKLLEHSCDMVRLYSTLALGRIGSKHRWVRLGLSKMLNDTNVSVRIVAKASLKRIKLIRPERRTHIVIRTSRIYEEANLSSKYVSLSPGTNVKALRWHIPSSAAEKYPRGHVLLYDRMMLAQTRQIGYVPRAGLNEIVVV